MWPFSRRDSDFDREIEAHIAIETEQLIADGASPEEARHVARRTFGNVTAARERFHESNRAPWIEPLLQDVRVAIRSSLRDRGVMLLALLSLALGIGATTAIVSTVDAVLLRPLPYREPDRLVMVWEDASFAGFPQNTPAPGNFIDWQARNRVFEDMAATMPARVNLTGDGTPERVLGRRVTASFFSVLGVQPQLGRMFTEDEDRQKAPVVVISHSLWQRRYAGDPAVIGRQLTMNDTAATVIGVMPPSFAFRDREMEFWVPIAFTPAQRALRSIHMLNVVARLKPGVDLAAARAEMRWIAAGLEREHRDNTGVGIVLVPIRDEVFAPSNRPGGAADTRQQLVVLSVAAGCLLLLMAANLANLLVARAAARRRELATRAALGAGRARLIAQMMAEGVIWSLLGGALGVAVAVAGLEVLDALIPVGLSAAVTPQLDVRLLLVAFGLSVATGVGFSLVPAIRESRVGPNDALKAAGGGVGGGWGTRSILITVQIAASIALLIGAGLMVQSLANMRAVEVGFRPQGLITASIALPARYDQVQRAAFYDRVLEEVRGVPGVVAAGFGSMLPFVSLGNTAGYRVDGREPIPGNPSDALFRVTTNDYLRTLGARLVEGRLPDERDGPDAPPVVVINKSFADLYWPGGTAVGNRIALNNPDAPWMIVIGVVTDVHERGYGIALKPGMYPLAAQVGSPVDNLVVRTTGNPQAIVPVVRQIVARLDPEQPVAAVRTMEEIIDLQVVDRRQQSVVLTAFAATALLLASIGIYGLVSFSVTMRRREVGLRTALGGSVWEVTRALVTHGLTLVAAGVAIGLAAALAGTRLMEGLLFGVQAHDAATFASITAIVLAVSAFACWLPAWRAARMEPMIALRQD